MLERERRSDELPTVMGRLTNKPFFGKNSLLWRYDLEVDALFREGHLLPVLRHILSQ
jgi:hypothetical protein